MFIPLLCFDVGADTVAICPIIAILCEFMHCLVYVLFTVPNSAMVSQN